MKTLVPRVLQAVAVGGYVVDAYMNDGTVRRYDVAPLIEKGGVFTQIADEQVFRSTLTVLNETVAWDISGDRDTYKCIDIDPCTLQAQPRVDIS